jgi:hypothetical protein
MKRIKELRTRNGKTTIAYHPMPDHIIHKRLAEMKAAGMDVSIDGEMNSVRGPKAGGRHPEAMNAGDNLARRSIQEEAHWGEDNELDEMFWNDDEESY